MFNKFKNQLSENSGFNSSPSILNSFKTDRKNSAKKIEPVESGVSEDSDENSSQKSGLDSIKLNNKNFSINEHNDSPQSASNGTDDSKDSVTDYKAKLNELNKSLLKEIDNLHVNYFN